MTHNPYGQPPPEQQPTWQQPAGQPQPGLPPQSPSPQGWQQPPAAEQPTWQQPGASQSTWQQPGTPPGGWQQPGTPPGAWQQPGTPPGGWQQPGGWPPPPPPPKRRRTGLIVALVAGGLAVVLCMAVGIVAVAVRFLADNDQTGGVASEQPGDVGDPFSGTPAESFADGEAGIQLPEAQAAGDFRLEEVAGALEQVRAALIASRIDSRMLVSRDPVTFIEMMSPATHDFLWDEFDSDNFGYFASQLASGAELAVATPRVEGTVTYHATLDSGGIRVIEISTSFVWAYAFEVPADSEVDGIVVVRDQLVWHLPHEDDVSPEATGLWLWEGEAYAWGIDCDAFERSLLAPQTERLAPGFNGTVDEGQMFDPEGSLNLPNTC